MLTQPKGAALTPKSEMVDGIESLPCVAAGLKGTFSYRMRNATF